MRLADLAGKDVLVLGAAGEASTFLQVARRLGIEIRPTIVDEAGDATVLEGVAVTRPVNLLDMVEAADVIVRSPGFSQHRPELEVAYRQGKVTTATKLWFNEPHRHVIGVTGTKGKSTTSSLVAHMLTNVGRNTILAGNIGRSPLAYLGDDEPDHREPDHWVVELSSFQTSDLDVSPDVGVLTSLSPEHLDWHGSDERYYADKLNLFEHNSNMTSVFNALDVRCLKAAAHLPNPLPANDSAGVHVEGDWFFQGDRQLFPTSTSRLIGRHNLALACLALATIGAAGVDVVAEADTLGRAVSSFEPLPHRLAPVGEYRGVLYVNDSLATNPLPTMAAVDAFPGRQITLLLGGYDRGLSYEELGTFIARHVPALQVVVMPDTGERIAQAIQAASTAPLTVRHVKTLAEAVQVAAEVTPRGGVVLLSPASASFTEFRNYAERGDAFTELVAALSP